MARATILSRVSKTLHKSRWDRVQQGMSIEEVAKQDKVGKDVIERSIRCVELYRVSCSPNEVEVRQAETLIALADDDEASIRLSLNAMHDVYDDKGKLIGQVPDYQVRLEASKVYTERLEKILPKRNVPAGNNVNVNLQTNVGVLGRGVVTFEDRLREIQ